ncbi:MAG: hypothetical protein U0175_28345 [Caldilineaceae bacterium]
MNSKIRTYAMLFVSVFLISLVTWLQVDQGFAQSNATAQNAIYLPMVSNNGKGNSEQPGTQVPLSLFLDPTWKTSDANVVVDAAGGEHVAFYYYEPKFEDRPNYALYSYCPSQCDKGESWKSIGLAQDKDVNEVQLALNSAGKPRLLIRATSALNENGLDFFYAACDGDCSQASGWTLTRVRTNLGTASVEYRDDDLPQRTFALDPAGRPRFIYVDRQNSNYGTFYVYCDNNCDKQESWQQVRINKVIQSPQFRDDDILYPTLTFTSDGKPRVVTADFQPLDDSDLSLAYIECNDGCNQSENWQAVKIAVRGSGSQASADLEFDADNHPRIAFYQEGLLEQKGNKLFYLWCDNECLNSTNWQQRDLGLNTMDGQEPDLELDSAGRPRIAYADYDQGGVGITWCNEACETPGAQWQNKLIEDRNKLYQAWPVVYPPHCDGGIWDGNTPRLILRGKGDPQLAYDGTYHARCFYDEDPTDNEPPIMALHLIERSVRLISFADPFNVPPDTGTPTLTRTPTPTRTPTATATPTVTQTPSPTPVGISKSLAVFADTQWKTSNASIAVDGTGRKHRAFYYDEAGTAGAPSYAVYQSCASGCENANNWKGMSFASDVNEVQLKVDAANKPHLLIRTKSTTVDNSYEYYYAVCTGDCTQESGWEMIGMVRSVGGSAYEQHDAEQPQRSFELDPNGRPRFVYLDNDLSADPLHVGVFYVWCDQNCGSDINEWHETLITDIDAWNGQIEKQEKAYYLSLAFTNQGQPRLVTAEYYPYLDTTDTVWRMGYFECNDMCDQGFLWSAVAIYDRGTGPVPSADLAIDGAGHPHVAFYQETTDGILPGGGHMPIPPHLIYLTCTESNCLNAMNWNGIALNTGDNNGAAPDIELDAQGHPRIAYTLGATGGLGYSWCNGDCLNSTGQTWKHGIIETRAQLQAALPKSHPNHCDSGGWTALTPTLIVPNTGHPHVAYDATYIAHCQHGNTWHDDVLMRAVRVVSFTQP